MELPEGDCEFVPEVYGDEICAEKHCLLLLKALIWFGASCETMVEEI